MLDVKGLLTRDAICRKLRKWPLLSSDQMQDVLKNTEFLRARLQLGNLIAIREEFCVASRIVEEMGIPYVWPSVEENALYRLNAWFPYSLDLLKHFEGKIVAAGGAVFRALYGDISNDVDFFFVDPDVETLDPTSGRIKYDGLLAEAISFLTDQWLYGKQPDSILDDDWQPETHNVYVLRSEFVTTVYLISPNIRDTKYQFIHRVYPSVGAVLGGFDLGPCMVAIDGTRILATELGAWSALGATLIVDTSRRSTSFEHRIRKYSKYCHIVLPGLPPNLVELKGALRPPPETVLEELEELVEDKGYCVKYRTGEPYRQAAEKSARLLMESARLDSCEERMTNEEMLKKLKHSASEYGFKIENLELVRLIPDRPTTSHSELIELLNQTARSRGYKLNHHAFAQCLAIKNCDKSVRRAYKAILQEDHDLRGEKWTALTPCRFLFEMPYARLNLEACHPSFEATGWSISPLRGRNKFQRKSDYEDRTTWCSKCVDTNISMLAGNNLSAVASCIILTAPGVSILTPHGEKPGEASRFDTTGISIRQLGLLLDCARNVTKGQGKEILLQSFREPTFGNLEKEFDVHYYEDIREDLFVMLSGQKRDDSIRDHMWGIMQSRLEATKLKLTGIAWRTRNPGTQWTGSINPVVAHPRDWYGLYRSFRIGCEEVETCLRLMRRREGLWRLLPKDIFADILVRVVWENSLLTGVARDSPMRKQ